MEAGSLCHVMTTQRYTEVQLAKWLAGKREQLRSGHLLALSLCARVIERMREVTNRRAAEWL